MATARANEATRWMAEQGLPPGRGRGDAVSEEFGSQSVPTPSSHLVPTRFPLGDEDSPLPEFDWKGPEMGDLPSIGNSLTVQSSGLLDRIGLLRWEPVPGTRKKGLRTVSM